LSKECYNNVKGGNWVRKISQPIKPVNAHPKEKSRMDDQEKKGERFTFAWLGNV